MVHSNNMISVVTPSFNQGRFILKTIESVRDQGVDNIEHIVVDGGSTDETVAILESFPHLRWTSEPDRGQADALNKGLSRARGQWIVWINSDDYLLPGALEKFVTFIETQPGARFVYSNCTFVDENNRTVEKRRACYDPGCFCYWWKEGGAGFAQPGTFFHRSLWLEYGPFNVALQYMMDYDFWLKLHGRVRFYHLDEDLAVYRLHRQAKTFHGWRPFVEEGIQITRKHRTGQGCWLRCKTAWMLKYMYGMQLMCEGMRSWERGSKKEAWKLWVRSWAANPAAFVSLTHMRFRLRQITGPRLYARLCRKVPDLQKLEKTLRHDAYKKI